jgi:hypothetical protein
MKTKGSLLKIEFVLDVARRYPNFHADLKANTLETLQTSGIDLSEGEILAIADIIHGTYTSRISYRLDNLRSLWSDICAEHKL